ncbi:hypothetical protein G9F71_004585 [Clostridium sp. FP2]|nr:hypothetical protein [Clostridium sp. FP2]MBZ9622136.1 hypothetical protein [Clostridium sp. FP2]
MVILFNKLKKKLEREIEIEIEILKQKLATYEDIRVALLNITSKIIAL